GPVVAYRKVGVAGGDQSVLRGKIEKGKPVVVGVAGDHTARRKGLGRGLHGDKKGIGGTAAVLAIGGHEDLLLGADNILVGRRVRDRVVVHLVHCRGVIEYVQVGVPQGDQGRVHGKVKGGKAVVRGTAVHKVVAKGKVVPYTDGWEKLDLERKGGHPGATGDQAFQAHPDDLRRTGAYVRGRVGDLRPGDPGIGIGLQLVIGNGQKVYGQLVPEHAIILKGQVKDGRAASALVAPDKGVCERWA